MFLDPSHVRGVTHFDLFVWISEILNGEISVGMLEHRP